MFRFVTSQLINSGGCRQVNILNTFGVSKSSVDRSLKQLRNEGTESFFNKRRSRKGGHVMTKEVLEEDQSLLNEEYSSRNIAEMLGIEDDTLRKAIDDGRLSKPKSPKTTTDKSSRSAVDAAAGAEMGVGCTRPEERVMASIGKLEGASVKFEAAFVRY